MMFMLWHPLKWLQQINQWTNRIQNSYRFRLKERQRHISCSRSIQFQNQVHFSKRHWASLLQIFAVLFRAVSRLNKESKLEFVCQSTIHNFLCFTSDILVATRRCVGRLKDLTSEEIVDFFMTVCKTQRLLEEFYETTSSTVTVQDGQFAGQTVRVIWKATISIIVISICETKSNFACFSEMIPFSMCTAI